MRDANDAVAFAILLALALFGLLFAIFGGERDGGACVGKGAGRAV